MATAKVLNVGGGSKAITLPPIFKDFEHILLDIDPLSNPDLVWDARELDVLEPNMFDAIYCSHNLEHYYYHEVPKVLAGMFHVLKPGGLVYILVPDILDAIDMMRAKGLDLEDDSLYESGIGPILTIDVIYGYHPEIERSGQPYFAHKTAFTPKSLTRKLETAGFVVNIVQQGNLELKAIATKPKGV